MTSRAASAAAASRWRRAACTTRRTSPLRRAKGHGSSSATTPTPTSSIANVGTSVAQAQVDRPRCRSVRVDRCPDPPEVTLDCRDPPRSMKDRDPMQPARQRSRPDPRAHAMRTFHLLVANTLVASVTNNFLWFALTFWIYLETRSVLATAIIGGGYMLLVAAVRDGLRDLRGPAPAPHVDAALEPLSLVAFAAGRRCSSSSRPGRRSATSATPRSGRCRARARGRDRRQPAHRSPCRRR